MITIRVYTPRNPLLIIDGFSVRVEGTASHLMGLIDSLLTGSHYIEAAELVAEPILLRALRRVREGSLPPEYLLVIMPCGTVNPVTPDGDFALPWPGGFFEWRAAELF